MTAAGAIFSFTQATDQVDFARAGESSEGIVRGTNVQLDTDAFKRELPLLK